MRITENDIALLRYRNRLTTGCCVSATPSKARFVTREGATVNVPMENVLLVAGPNGRTSADAEKVWGVAEARAARIDFEEIWSLVVEEDQAWSADDLVGLVGDEDDASLPLAVRVGLEESDFFEGVEDLYRPRSEGEVADVKASRAAADERARERDRLGAWLDGQIGVDEAGAELAEWTDRLKDYVLKDGGGAHAGWVERAAGRAMDPRRVFGRLVKAGAWDRHAHLDLERHEVPVAFDEGALREARMIAEGRGQTETSTETDRDREDLTHLRVFTIDEDTTRDIDDGISVEFFEDGGACVGVHIADAGAFVSAGSALGAAAADRLTSLYFPDLKVPMLPPELSEEAVSLVEAAERPAVTTLVSLDRDGEILQTRVVRSWIRVQKRLSYAEADRLLESVRERDHCAMRFLHTFAEGLLVDRRQAGAILVDSRELLVSVREDGSTELGYWDNSSPSAMMVSEMMVMANAAAADLARAEEIPMLYRGQVAPDLSDLTDQLAPALHRYWVLKRMGPAQLSIDPEPHGGLGLDAYCQCSSPIRRYVDLISQRQITSFLRGERPPLSQDEMQNVLVRCGDRLRQLSRIERRRKTYWLMVHLQGRLGETFEATYLEDRGRDGWVDIEALAMQTGIRPAPSCVPGEPLTVTLASTDAWEGRASFSATPGV